MKANNKYYLKIREFLNTIPVIDTHEHNTGVTTPPGDVFEYLISSYYHSDCFSASYKNENKVLESLRDHSMPFDYRYEIFEKVYTKSKNTAYARAVSLGLKECWNIDEINKRTIQELEEKMKGFNEEIFHNIMERNKIKAQVSDIYILNNFMKLVNDNEKGFSKHCRFAFPLPAFHNINKKGDILILQNYLGTLITCLDDYLEAFENFLRKCIDFGVICLKDQSAYSRSINYNYPAREEAEKVFNAIISHPRNVYSTDETRVLDDWLFHYFIRMARKYDLPIQVHTGHMAGQRNDIVKANAANFISVLELHTEVGFDLFHGNWPYMDEILFIIKNYPNAFLDLCWVQSIDPIYSVELMKRAIVSVPNSKVMAFGGDTTRVEWTTGYLVMARDNVACALSEMVDSKWIGLNDAKKIAVDWFYNNPNEFFNLGFENVNN